MEIKVYTSPTCTWCQKLREWFKKNRLPYRELDISESDTYRDELIAISRQMAVPTIDFDGTIIVGYNEKKLEEVLQKVKGKK